jgi:hypothetical protein
VWLQRALAGGNANFLRNSAAVLAQAGQPAIRAMAEPYAQRLRALEL